MDISGSILSDSLGFPPSLVFPIDGGRYSLFDGRVGYIPLPDKSPRWHGENSWITLRDVGSQALVLGTNTAACTWLTVAAWTGVYEMGIYNDIREGKKRLRCMCYVG